MNIRIAICGIAEFFPDLPVPVCKKAISKAIKDSKYEPRKGGDRERDEIPLARSFRNPAKEVEQDECDVKYEEKCICDLVYAIVVPFDLIQKYRDETLKQRLKLLCALQTQSLRCNASKRVRSLLRLGVESAGIRF